MLLIGEGTATGSDGEKQGCVLLRNESQIMLHFTNFQTQNIAEGLQGWYVGSAW